MEINIVAQRRNGERNQARVDRNAEEGGIHESNVADCSQAERVLTVSARCWGGIEERADARRAKPLRCEPREQRVSQHHALRCAVNTTMRREAVDREQ